MPVPLLSVLLLACAPDVVSTPDDAPLAPWELRSATLTWSADPLAGDASPFGEPMPDALWLDPFDDVSVDVPRVRADRDGAWAGWLGASGDTTVRLRGRGGLVAGTVRTGGRLLQIRPVAPGVSRVVELDESALPPEADAAAADVPGAPSPDAGSADGFVDQLVVYTAAAAAGAGGVDAMEATIALAVAETNDGFAASGIPQRVRLVGTAQVEYDEAGLDWSTTLADLSGTTDGHMDLVHGLRDVDGADEVTLLVDDATYCGLAYLMSKPSAGFQSQAFSVVSRTCATGYYSFGHELGHVLGSDHDHAHGNTGARAWSYGHRDPGGALRTVMAYDCDGGCPRVNRWSNPLQTLDGVALGVAGSGKSAADNVRSVTELADVVSAFRAPTAGVVPPSTVTAPAADSRLGASATFTWTARGATDHAIAVGATRGGSEWFGAEHLGGGSGSFLVSGLPDDGTRVFVRLWSLVDGAWAFEDSSYLAAEAPSVLPGPPVTAPRPGTVLPGDTVALTWADVGAAEYHVYVGREKGSYDLLSTSTGTTPRLTLTHLPVDGGEVWVRVWAYTPDVWMWTDAEFVAALR